MWREGMGYGKESGAKGTIKPASLSFSKALVKAMSNGVNCLAGLYAYGLGGGRAVVVAASQFEQCKTAKHKLDDTDTVDEINEL